MQHEVTDVQKLLDKQGYIVTPGWARRPVWQYNRENIAAPSFRIKEWDYYLAGNEHYAVAFTLSASTRVLIRSYKTGRSVVKPMM